MKITIPAPAGWVERPGITSRAIQRSGFKRFGVIYTTSDNPSPADFNTNDILGATLEHLRFRAEGKDNRFFTIVGGYYLQKIIEADETPGIRTRNVFGVAIKSDTENQGFSIEEGGTTIIGDEWKFWPPIAPQNINRGFSLDERNSDHEGWTLIVQEAKFPGEYPWSFNPLELTVPCPVATNLALVPTETKADSITIEATVTVNGITPDKFDWDWGDGTTETTTSPVASHAYARGQGTSDTYTVTVNAQKGDCSSTISKDTPIPGCPAIKELTATVGQTVNPLAPTQPVKAEVTIVVPDGGSAPTKYTWDWGDGETTETTDPIAAHEYKRPFGADKTFTITVTTSGDDQCSAQDTAEVTIVKLCPNIVDIIAETISQDADTETIRFKVVVEGPEPDSYNWVFEEGATKDNGGKEEEHTYQRPEGEDKIVKVKVTSNGPGSDDGMCSDTYAEDVKIEGKCPSIETLDVEKIGRTTESETVRLNVLVKGNPSEVKVNWGDGSEEVLTDYSGEHTYSCAPDGDKKYAITVTITGPGSCPASSETTEIIITCPQCPTITGIECTKIDYLNDQLARVDLKALYTGADPTEFNWTFGDGATRTTSSATVSHEYKRPQPGTQDLTRSVSVTTSGPGGCSGEAARQISLGAAVVVTPWYCKYMDRIIALLLALAAGSGIVCYVAEFIPDTGANSIPLTVFSIFTVLAMIGLFLWYFLGSRNGCPPSRCGILGAVWTALITMGLMGMYMYQDCGLSIVTGVIITILGGGFMGWWAMTCKDDNKMLKALTYIGIAVLSIIILVFGVANAANFACMQ